MLERLAGEGRRDLLTMGITPVLAAQLDDPYVLREFHTLLGFGGRAPKHSRVGATGVCVTMRA